MNYKAPIFTLLVASIFFFLASESNAQVYSSGFYRPGIVQNSQVVRYGTPLYGVRAVPGQVVRYGTPRAGVRVTGNGVRIGTPRWGVQFGNGRGVQVGRINRWIGR